MRLPQLLTRAAWVGTSSLLAVGGLVVFFAWLALQAQWQVPDPGALSGPTQLRARDGTVIARFTSEVDRRLVDLDDVSPYVVDAVVANEDERFYDHDGVDPLSLVRAIATNVRTGGISQGGSTLTQQYVKNAFTGAERTIIRKVREAVISIQLERDLTKQQILERYLNTVYFGEGAYGVEAAALTYFGVRASELSAAQAAQLAQLLPAPSLRNPRADPEGADRRGDAVLAKMQQLGYLSPDEADDAATQEVAVLPRRPAPTVAPFFVAYVRRQLEIAYGKQTVLTGALDVTTSLDLSAQEHLDAAVDDQLLSQEPGPFRAGAVALDPRNGDILAIHGGPDFRTRSFDLATQGRRQNGSTFKPIAFAAALEAGIDPSTGYPSPGRTVITRDNCPPYGGAPEGVVGGPGGSMSLREGLIRSVNTVFIRVGCDVGPEAIVDLGLRLGVRNRISPNVSVALGGSDFGGSVLDMASAFGTLANDGVYCPARAILSVRGPDGEEQPLPREVTIVPGMEPRFRSLTQPELAARPEGLAERDEGRCVGALDADIARTTTQALEQVVARSTGRRAAIERPQAGKTGTTNEEKDAWFAGYTPELSLAVWIGHPDSTEASIHDVAGFSRVQGGTIPALIWRDAAREILAGVSPSSFLEPGELNLGDERAWPAPARPRPTATPSPEPSPTPSPEPTGDPPGGDPTGGDPTEDGSEPPDDGGTEDDEDDEDCLIVLGDCD